MGRMASLESYGMSDMIMTGSFNKEMIAIDMSTECDAYYFERNRRQKRINLGLTMDASNEQISESALHEQSFGLMAKTELSDIMTACSVHPKSLYTVCGSLSNSLEIVACSSNPFDSETETETI